MCHVIGEFFIPFWIYQKCEKGQEAESRKKFKNILKNFSFHIYEEDVLTRRGKNLKLLMIIAASSLKYPSLLLHTTQYEVN